MRRILLVDDDTEFREGLLRRFRPHRQEWQVAAAGNGSDALRLAREQSFDLVITDNLMPEKDGVETVIAFKGEHHWIIAAPAQLQGICTAQNKPSFASTRLGSQCWQFACRLSVQDQVDRAHEGQEAWKSGTHAAAPIDEVGNFGDGTRQGLDLHHAAAYSWGKASRSIIT